MIQEATSSTGEQAVKTACALCVHSCGMNAYVRDGKIVRVEGMAEHPLNKGELCPRGQAVLDFQYAPERLKYPLKRTEQGWQRISWDEALEAIANKLTQIKERYGARAVAFACGSIGAEDIMMAAFTQRFRGAFGSPNYISAESICFHSLIMSRILTFGRFPLEDPANARCIVVWGSNIDASNFPRARMVREAVQNGAKLIVIDPKRTKLAKEGIYLQVRPGTDGALALAMIHQIIYEGLYDDEFIEKWTVGFDKLKDHVKQYTPEMVEAITGVAAIDIKRTARIFATSKPACIIQGTCSIDQQTHGIQTMRAMAILQAITGNYDIPGTWVRCPIIRLTDLRLPVPEKPMGADKYPLFCELWGRVFPYGQGLSFPDMVLTGNPYPIEAFVGVGTNWAVTFPEAPKFRAALKKLDLVAVMDVFMTETTELAHIALPAKTFLERPSIGYTYGVVEGIPYVMSRKKVADAPGECWSEYEFWHHLALRMGLEEYFPWRTEDEAIDHLLEPSGVNLQILSQKPSGVYFASIEYKTYERKGFDTPSGKVELYSDTLEKAGYDPLPTYKEPTQSPMSTPALAKEYPLILVTGTRMPEFTHSQFHHLPRLRSRVPEPLAKIHPSTLAEYKITNGEMIAVETPKGSIKIRADADEDLLPQVVSIPHGWSQANANDLTDLDLRDDISGFPQLRAILCRVRKTQKG